MCGSFVSTHGIGSCDGSAKASLEEPHNWGQACSFFGLSRILAFHFYWTEFPSDIPVHYRNLDSRVYPGQGAVANSMVRLFRHSADSYTFHVVCLTCIPYSLSHRKPLTRRSIHFQRVAFFPSLEVQHTSDAANVFHPPPTP
jgi:hypothetical protein